MEMPGKQPLSLYFHVPFCQKKCPYCHFYVIKDHEIKKDLLLKAFFQEWALLKIPDNHIIVSIYLGGGTPSLMGPLRLNSLLDFIRSQNIEIAQDCEVTLEANPCDVSVETMQGFIKAGINRISLGVQSLHNPSLLTIGRKHTATQAMKALDAIKEAGIANVSIDLMYDRPDQTVSDWEIELDEIKNLPITHLSLYNMTIEEGSAYKKIEAKIKSKMPDAQKSLELHQKAIEALKDHGFIRYEISAFCKKGYQSRHNLGYWQARPFYGFGPSAFSYINGSRKQNICHFDMYLERITAGQLAYEFEETLDTKASLQELLAIGLRVSEGIDLDEFQKRFGLFSYDLEQSINHLIDRGFLSKKEKQLSLTDSGKLFYDDVGIALI